MTLSPVYSKAECIELYISAGFSLFPCKDDRTPAHRGWQAHQYGPDDLTGRFFGFRIPANVAVFDVDPRRLKDYPQNFKQLLDKFSVPTPLDTFMVNTRSGGRHVYTACKPGRNFQMYVPEFESIECKGLGRYVIAAGSEGYNILRGTPDQLMRAPEKLLEWCEQETRNKTSDVEDDSHANQGRFIRYCLNEAEPAIEGQHGDNTTLKTAMVGRDYGLSEPTCFGIMLEYYNSRCAPRWADAELATKVRNAYAYAQNSRGTKSTTIAADYLESVSSRNITVTSHEVLKPEVRWDHVWKAGECTTALTGHLMNHVSWFILDHGETENSANPLKDLLAYNLMTHKIEFTKRAPWHREYKQEWEDEDNANCLYYLQIRRHYKAASMVKLLEALPVIALSNPIHPLRDWLCSIRWDGIKRLDMWLHKYCHVKDSKYSRHVAKVMIMAPVKRVLDPGCKFDDMPILEGAQGVYKSTLISILGGEYYADIPLNVTTEQDLKRTVHKTIGKWIVECSEMVFTKREEMDAVKSFLSNSSDTVMLNYARHAKTIKRQFMYIGSFNPTVGDGYLMDSTGNRRFLPVYIGDKINYRSIADIREQLFAEAVYRVRQGEILHIEDEETAKQAIIEQRKREVREMWEYSIMEYMSDNTGISVEGKSTEWIAHHILTIPRSRMNMYIAKKVARAMISLGYELKQKRGIEAKRVYIWVKK